MHSKIWKVLNDCSKWNSGWFYHMLWICSWNIFKADTCILISFLIYSYHNFVCSLPWNYLRIPTFVFKAIAYTYYFLEKLLVVLKWTMYDLLHSFKCAIKLLFPLIRPFQIMREIRDFLFFLMDYFPF